MDLSTLANRAKQLNPNNLLFWKSRGLTERPLDWQDLVVGPIIAKSAFGLKKAVLLCSLKGVLCVGTVIGVGVVSYYYYNKNKEVHNHASFATNTVRKAAGGLSSLASNVGYYCGISASK